MTMQKTLARQAAAALAAGDIGQADHDLFLSELSVDEATVRDVRPADCGRADGCWFIGRCADGRWLAATDEVIQSPVFFATEGEAIAYWHAAAEAERSARS